MAQEEGKTLLRGLSGNYTGLEYRLEKDEFIIGRRPQCDLVLNEKTISASHSKIVKEGDGHFVVCDMGSTNGTFVNGKRIERTRLRSEDIVAFDIIEFRFQDIKDVSRTMLSSVLPPEMQVPPQAPPSQAQAPPPPPQTPSPPPPQEPQAPQLMEPEELDETAPLPSESDLTPPPPPMASQPSPPPQAPLPPQAGAIGQRPPKPVATPSAAGFLFKGLLLGVPIALCMNYAILLLAAFSKASADEKFTQLLQAILGAFPIVHLHKNWTSTPQWDVSTVFIAVCIPVGLILGGLICQKFACRNRLVAAALFSLIYVALAVLLQLVALEFNMIAWKFIYAAAGINTGQEAMNVVVNILYFYGVTFIFSFLGTLFGKSK